MNGFEADPVLLRAAGRRFGTLAAEFAACPELRYAAKAEQAGDVLLARALGELQEASTRAAELLLDEARELGARLERAARLYAGQDADAHDAVGLIGPAESSGPARLG
ncbi:hypothetical protein AB0M80_29100 [Amycolatopsis sp. NPDC051045]|uniref:hypothetical protein n=1 Tax=Amycolatopsis sp. NPDC051045 TaxID=3156922 RepID=UPI003431CA5E